MSNFIITNLFLTSNNFNKINLHTSLANLTLVKVFYFQNKNMLKVLQTPLIHITI